MSVPVGQIGQRGRQQAAQARRDQAPQTERLLRARVALAQAEGRQEVVSMSQKLSVSSRQGRGVFHLDGTIQGMAQGLSLLLQEEQFAAVVGVANVSWEGVESFGVDVSRIVVIRNVGDQGFKVVSSLLEGFSVLVLGEVSLLPRQQRVLAARARALGTTILTWQAWPTLTLPLLGEREQFGTHLEANPLLQNRKAAS